MAFNPVNEELFHAETCMQMFIVAYFSVLKQGWRNLITIPFNMVQITIRLFRDEFPRL